MSEANKTAPERAESRMQETIHENELSEILARDPEEIRARVVSQAGLSLTGELPPLALYGAGTLGREVLARLRRAGVEPVAFADDTPEKQGQTLDGVPIMRPREVREKFGEQLIFVVTILNPALRFLDARARLENETGARAISFLSLAWKYPDEFLPYYQFEPPSELLKNADAIREGLRILADDESRRQFIAHLRFRLSLDYNELPTNSLDEYFPAEILPNLPADTVFIDCGAFDGDTIRRFLDHQHGRFGAIYAFEPDEQNFARLSEYAAGLGEAASRVHVFRAGVGGERGTLRFNSTGNMSASFSTNGEVEVDVLPISEVVKANGRPVYIKFDVEGAEREALRGAEELIAAAPPLMAVSIYHRPDDLWKLPIYLKSIDPSYRLFLRTQGEDGMDVICYAVPAGMASGFQTL